VPPRAWTPTASSTSSSPQANSPPTASGTAAAGAPPDERDLLVVEVADAGRLDDPLAGRRPAPPHQLGGRGLLMVHHLADLVRTTTGPGGTATRTYWRR